MRRLKYETKTPSNVSHINELVIKDIFEDLLLDDKRNKNWRSEIDAW
jgi:hypothetical protein